MFQHDRLINFYSIAYSKETIPCSHRKSKARLLIEHWDRQPAGFGQRSNVAASDIAEIRAIQERRRRYLNIGQVCLPQY
jgi:hypothetical protein